jgi:hypothetical protein
MCSGNVRHEQPIGHSLLEVFEHSRVSPAGALIANASPSAVTGKYLAVWEKIGNDWKLECRFEDQWARHWEKIHRRILGEDHRR